MKATVEPSFPTCLRPSSVGGETETVRTTAIPPDCGESFFPGDKTPTASAASLHAPSLRRDVTTSGKPVTRNEVPHGVGTDGSTHSKDNGTTSRKAGRHATCRETNN